MKIKQYIVLRPHITPSTACIAVGHGVLASYIKWQDDQVTKDWVSGAYGPFYKVICQAESLEQFEAIKKWNDNISITESKLDNLCVCVAFKPIVWTKSSIFNELKLYA